MDNPEIILNLWYVYDDLGTIYSLRGRCYIGSGSDEEKLALLRRFATTDYLIAQPFPVPGRLHTTLVTEEATRKLPVIGTGPVEWMGGPGVLFEEVFVELDEQLPTQTRLSIGVNPLICITPLLGDEEGNLRPDTSPSGELRSLRNAIPDEPGPGADVPAEKSQRGKNRTKIRSRPDLVAAAMGAQGGQIPLEENTTFRWRPNAGDYLLCIHCTDPSGYPPKFEITDFWEFREGDRLLITNREEDYPATTGQMEEGGPSLWKVVPCDRLAWVGWRGQSNERNPTLVALVNCCREGYVYGEPESPTLESLMSFGTPTSKATEEIRTLWMVGFDAAVALGLP